MTMTITMIGNRHTHQWSSDLMLWQCENFWIIRKPQIMTLRLLIWKGSVMISPSSQGQLMEDQVDGQRVCLPSLVFTVGLFVASRGRFLSRGRSGEVEQSRRGLQSSSVPWRDHQHSQVDAREARTLDIVISIIIINIIKETTFPIGPWWYLFWRGSFVFCQQSPVFLPKIKIHFESFISSQGWRCHGGLFLQNYDLIDTYTRNLVFWK